MSFERLQPVALITGAASALGGACASAIARRAEGGLVLADSNEPGLEAAADGLAFPPERVSTLAFDAASEARWADACAFIKSQYGRLDWAVINAPAAPAATDLVQWDAPSALEQVILSLAPVMDLMRHNAGGGAIVITAPAAALSARPGLLDVVRAAAKEAASYDVRVNALAVGAAEAPSFQELANSAGGERAAFSALEAMPTPLARYAGAAPARLIDTLLSGAGAVSGVTLVVDAGYAI
ncbi:MAG: SDR family oxidoreductase [Hyphomonadaceae bacterium]|nr:SDR family oxidoreductase [Hyphomonadaceae bacterium]